MLASRERRYAYAASAAIRTGRQEDPGIRRRGIIRQSALPLRARAQTRGAASPECGTLHGSEVGDLFMSLIHTCELAGANAFDYLSQLQRHAAELAEKSNQEWG